MSRSRALLQVLADGRFHAGPELGERLGCSRAAVWKAVHGLERAGLEVFRVRGKGYRLARPLELLDATAILQAMRPAYRQRLAEVEVLFETDSTNTRLLAQPLAADGLARACLAESQTAGRGRRGRSWLSPLGGNLALSLGWRFQRSMAEMGGLSLAVGVAVARALSEVGAEAVQLKWPNDLLADGRKLAGILLQVSGEAAGPCDIVMGVGLNLHPSRLATSIDQPWTTLEDLLAAPPGRNALAGRLLDHLVHAAGEFDREGLAPFVDEWRRRDAFAGRSVVLQTAQGESRGVVQGIDAEGALLLTGASGTVQAFHSGEVSLRPQGVGVV